MATSPPSIPTKRTYQRSYWGVYGEFGASANARVRFVQTAIRAEELQDIDLIGNIPGSETWDVVDLFQRDVDDDRVENHLIPYLEDSNKVKFFNPLTLLVLPMEDAGRKVRRDLNPLTEYNRNVDGEEMRILENEGYFQFQSPIDNEHFAELRWNPHRCHLVAIDGQHRLSALQRIYKKPNPRVNLGSWKVPVVVLTMEQASESNQESTLLDLVRSTFVYINTTAVRVNPAREILLNDESPNAICTQEFVQDAHSNDNREISRRDETRIPLLLLDWRGETSNGVRVSAPAALKSVEEIHSWLATYILGDDFSDRQQAELELTDLIPPLKTYGKDRALSNQDASRLRKQFRDLVLPGLNVFLQQFSPYKDYIQRIRDIENRALEESDLAQHAFMKLRFGSHNGPEDQRDTIHGIYENLVHEITGHKGQLPPLMKLDIGMRGVMYALGHLKRLIGDKMVQAGADRPAWMTIAEALVPYFNQVVDEGWFSVQAGDPNADRRKLDLLTYLVFDASGGIINYRIGDAENALGTFLELLITCKVARDSESHLLDDGTLEELWSDSAEILRKTISKEIRKAVRARLKHTYEGTMEQINRKVKEQTDQETDNHLERIATELGLPYYA